MCIEIEGISICTHVRQQKSRNVCQNNYLKQVLELISRNRFSTKMISLQLKPTMNNKSNETKTKRLKMQRSISYLKEYTQVSTVHGIQHIFRDGETIWHRVIWTVLFIMSFSGAIYLIWNSWEGYVQYPVQILVTDTMSNFNEELFPAITICPSHKLLISKAKAYLRNQSINEEILKDKRIEDYLSALALFQHPLFYQMQYFLEKSEPILSYLKHVNISDLMYEGKPKKCCKTMFKLQRTEEGFCYSFNSLTSENHNHCTADDEKNRKNGCRLKRNSLGAIGPTTGAEIFIKIVDSLKLKPVEFTGSTNVRAQIHHPHEFPEPGVGILLPVDNLNKADMAIKVTITKSSNDIRGLNLQDRGCIFRNERELNITKIYSQRSCIMECRLRYILKRCHCLPYYFNNYNEGRKLPICNSLRLKCIVSLNEDLRFYKPPNIHMELHDTETHSALDCTHCLPTCNEVNYEFVSERTKNFYVTSNNFDGCFDVYFKSADAVTYQREVSFNAMQLLVNLGGIGGLFLGGSLLSILEILFWLCKAIISQTFSAKNLINKKKKKAKASVVQAWVK